MPNKSESAPHEQILSAILGYWQARAIALVTELGLPDILVGGPKNVEELARLTDMEASALFRLLRALESIGIFAQSSPRAFVNTPTSECLRRDVLGSQWALTLSNLSRGNGLMDGWDELKYSVKTGLPALRKIYGFDFWELCRREPQIDALFNESMRSVTEVITPAVTGAYDWSQFPLIADIGGGIGTQLVSILDAFPSCRGILFDQPHVEARSMTHVRMNVISGDFFELAPADADVYLLRWIIHDWPEWDAVSILSRLRRTLKPTARLILAESIVPEGSAFDFGKWLDIQMLVSFGGRERTVKEYQTLLLSSGFALLEVVETPSPISLLVAKPA